ncbi:MAG: cell division protein FtsZ [Bacteroidales bacterium]|nr:cell division protein FtsZ [Bacteroidales bacterium]
MQFEQSSEQPAKIKVIGVGGGGGNAVNHMYRQGIHGVNFIVCNTDAKALAASPVPNKIELGKLGAGNVPEHARKAALEHKDEIREAISDNTQMLFITAGMGGGTGTGAAPVIAEIAKSIELDDDVVPRILVVAIVTMPFSFEGKRRREQALVGIEELRKHVDAILVINNDKLRHLGNLPLNQAFSQADDVLLTAAKGIAEIITVSAYVNIDFRDVNTVMEQSGTALMGAGEGRGENRARQAIEAATTSVLLDDNDIRGAKNILLYFSYNKDHQITMDELGEVTDYITDLTGNLDTNVIWGAGDDDNLNDELRITLIATGFEQRPSPRVISLDDNKETSKPVEATTKQSEPAVADVPVQERVADITVEKTDVRETVSEQEKDPFENIPSKKDGNRRIFTLEEPSAEEMEEIEMKETPKVKVEEPAMGINHLDEIRVIHRPSVEAAAPAAPRFQVEATEAFADVAVVASIEQKAAAAIERPQNLAEQQVAQAFTPAQSIDDQRIKQRADRIRMMNELLRNDPDGPRKIESMSVEELAGQPLYEAPHSSEQESSRTTVDAYGKMSSGMDFLNGLPD